MATEPTAEIAATLAKLASLIAHQNSTPEPDPPPNHPIPQRVLLTVEEAAQQLGIGRTKTFALVRAGQLESVQIGRLRGIPKTAIDDYTARLVTQQSTCPKAA